MNTRRTTRALGALALASALALTACGSGTDSGSGATGTSDSSVDPAADHNDADVAFASDMLQHHAQALAMVDLTMGRPLDPEVEQLAEQIREAQAPEIEQFNDWLTEWGEEVPPTVRDHANAHGSSDDMAGMDMGADMPGMMSDEQMTELEDSSDADFQTLWLQMMLEHHQGAVEMSTTEQEDGEYQPAVDLAGQIVSTQSAEIETMQGLLGS